MKINSLFEQKPCVFALEVFPPKRESGIQGVYQTLDKMGTIPLDYISVTYSAGGSGAKEYTGQLAAYIKDNLHIEPLAHLTCLNSQRQEIEQELQGLQKAGIENILALRGDRNPAITPSKDFAHASDLIAEVQRFGGFYMAAACYPEGHPESNSLAEDVEHLKLKVDAGAEHFVSQLFFDNGQFYRFLNLARKKGINKPVEAGVMPVVKLEQLERTISLSSASLPSAFSKMVSRYAQDATSFYEAGIEYAITQIRDLIESGTDGIHLYAMNNPDVAMRVRQGVADLL